MHTVYLSLGTNLGNKQSNLDNAINLIAERVGTLSAISSVYETEAWGFQSENSFLNMAVKVETKLTPFEILSATKEIEKELGRTEKTSTAYQDRVIDIDIIFYDNLLLQSEELKIPHPLYKERDFVTKPLNEIKKA
ncbi:2-amino-4-hydroxy-6-hydroxymethyldihydropteridine diphosphokinase [Dysgonomonadaceae bacterium PH5-43]|nr:2-amino-4-hydroxy-6-hydroxymethyldihydropteridine diphosphokinase [Dysgonomonadaceae bacterium PH5-43]